MPTATTIPLKFLLDDMLSGSLAVPNFQRDFVWSRAQVLEVLESIRSGIPLGTVTFWQCSQDTRKYFEGFFVKGRRRELDREAVRDGGWGTKVYENDREVGEAENGIIDGRQRLTSLLTIFGGISFGAPNHRLAGLWVLDLTKPFDAEETPFEFVKMTEVGAKYQSLSDWIRAAKFPLWLFSEDDLPKFQAAITQASHYPDGKVPDDVGKRATILSKLQGLLSSFHVAVYSLEKKVTLSQVCEIFEVLNTSGTKVSVFDIVHAKHLGTTSGQPFDLKQRIKEICEAAVGTNVTYLKHWIDENDGKGGKTICQIVTGMYIGSSENEILPDPAKPQSKRRMISTFKGGDLIETPLVFYRQILDKDLNGNDVEGFPGIQTLNQYAKDFAVATNGVVSRDWCPYPIMFSVYCSIRYDLRNDNFPVSLINDTFRPFFWTASLNQRYDQGFLSGAVKDRDYLVEFIRESADQYKNEKKTWWLLLNTFLTSKLSLNAKSLEDVKATVADTEPKGALAKLLRLLIFARVPRDLKTGAQLYPLREMDIELHHIFPRTWVTNNCKENLEYLDSFVALVPMLQTSNNEWKGSEPRQQLVAWHENKGPAQWSAWEGLMGTLMINEAAFGFLMNKELGAGQRFEGFFEARKNYIAEQLSLLMATADLVESLQYKNPD